MITDAQSNCLYLADTLPIKFPDFYERLQALLNANSIEYALLPNTKDIWAVDYMPIQVNDDKFIQFVYHPDYLKTKKWSRTISDTTSISRKINVSPEKCDIILDGGNVVKSEHSVIMCDKVFRENPSFSERELIRKLRDCFEIEDVFFVPQDQNDFTGHADGMVRFVDEKTVLINDLSKESRLFQTAFRMSIHNAGFEYIELPYSMDIYNADSAIGLYLNYLEMEDIIIMPVFGLSEDEAAFRALERIFSQRRIVTLDCRDIARHGGVMNCISWNIKKQHS